MNIHDYIQKLKDLKITWKEKKFNETYEKIHDIIKTYPTSYKLHVILSSAIQMSDTPLKEEGEPLDVAKKHLELAGELAPDLPEPFNELGYFSYAIEDDAKGAIKYFQKAYENNTRHFKETLVGLLKCYIELKDEKNYNSTIKLCNTIFPEDYEIDALKEEWDEIHSENKGNNDNS